MYGRTTNAYSILVEESQEKTLFQKSRCGWKDIIKWILNKWAVEM
jgi:hypothetical protein